MKLDFSAKSGGVTDTLPGRLAWHAARRPNQVALQYDDHGVTWTQLSEGANRVGGALLRAGCRPGDRVALLGEHSVSYWESYLGAVSAGLCAVFIPTLLAPDAIAAMVVDSEAKILLASATCRDAARYATRQPTHLLPGGRIAFDFHEAGWHSYESWRDEAPGEPLDLDIPSEAEFDIVYSSGTTGVPKGIVHTHATKTSLSAGFTALAFDEDTVALIATVSYSNFSVGAFLATVWAGGKTIILPRFDADDYLHTASQEHVTHFFMVPVMAHRLLDHPEFDRHALGATRLKYVGGSTLQVARKRELIDRWPGPLVEIYAMSEGGGAAALFAHEYPDKLDSVGRPVAGCEIKIIDEDDKELPSGETGEIVGRSGTMMLRYHNRPDATEAIRWCAPDGKTYFRSGDVGRFDADGFLYVLDRKKDMIISGGLNIYAADLEAVLATHPDVFDAAVIAVPSDRWGETPMAYVELEPGATTRAEEVLSWANERLGRYQRLARVELVDTLPRNTNGKVLKRDLREPHWKHEPNPIS